MYFNKVKNKRNLNEIFEIVIVNFEIVKVNYIF